MPESEKRGRKRGAFSFVAMAILLCGLFFPGAAAGKVLPRSLVLGVGINYPDQVVGRPYPVTEPPGKIPTPRWRLLGFDRTMPNYILSAAQMLGKEIVRDDGLFFCSQNPSWRKLLEDGTVDAVVASLEGNGDKDPEVETERLYLLGICYYIRSKNYTPDGTYESEQLSRAQEFFDAAARGGHIRALATLGILSKSAFVLEKASQQGSGMATAYLAELEFTQNLDGQVSDAKFRRLVQLLERAYNLGYWRAAGVLGRFIEFGDLTSFHCYSHTGYKVNPAFLDKVKGMEWWQKYIESGDENALWEYAFYHPNNPDSLGILLKLAEQGYDMAMFTLIDIYTEGTARQRPDPQKAAYWESRWQALTSD